MAGEVEMAEVDSHRFLAEGFGRVAYASLPTEEGERATIARGWAWALVAKDPHRQAAAKDFVEWMMEPGRLGAWCWATHHLPAGRSALRLAIEDREFRTFARQQLEAAHFRPPGPSYRDLALALQGAIESVIEGRASPEEAALQAIQALKE
jgi:ABC-type glycerol-3-phosphate transport system substrate-binding protein